MPADTNPFASLMTPETLRAQRIAKMEEEYADADPWTKMAAQAGFGIRERMREQGKMLEPEDIKAQRNATVLSGAQKRYAQLVKDGKMSADEAQAAVLQEAIAGFAANGSFEQALALTGPLTDLTKSIQERQKLKAQTVREEQNIINDAVKTDADVMRAEATMKTAIARGDEAAARVAVAEYDKQLKAAQTRLADARAAAALRGDGDGSGEKLSPRKEKVQISTNELLLGNATAARIMKQVLDVGLENPAGMTAAGPISTQLAVLSSGAKALIRGQQLDPEIMADGKTPVEQYIRNNVTDQKLQALVTDLAFAFARSRDPGGRLSNQDVEKAMEIVSGAGTPATRIAVLEQAYNNLVQHGKDAVRSAKSLGIGIPDDSVAMTEEAYSEFDSALAAHKSKYAKKKPGTGAPAGGKKVMSREEFLKSPEAAKYGIGGK